VNVNVMPITTVVLTSVVQALDIPTMTVLFRAVRAQWTLKPLTREREKDRQVRHYSGPHRESMSSRPHRQNHLSSLGWGCSPMPLLFHVIFCMGRACLLH
jgi:hypothetical protein